MSSSTHMKRAQKGTCLQTEYWGGASCRPQIVSQSSLVMDFRSQKDCLRKQGGWLLRMTRKAELCSVHKAERDVHRKTVYKYLGIFFTTAPNLKQLGKWTRGDTSVLTNRKTNKNQNKRRLTHAHSDFQINY